MRAGVEVNGDLKVHNVGAQKYASYLINNS